MKISKFELRVTLHLTVLLQKYDNLESQSQPAKVAWCLTAWRHLQLPKVESGTCTLEGAQSQGTMLLTLA